MTASIGATECFTHRFTLGMLCVILFDYQPAFSKALGQVVPPVEQRRTIPVFIGLLSARIAEVHIGTKDSDHEFQPVCFFNVR